ncbi:GNAT family N-acetyltransferase [Brevibacillus fluminis]|uniref:GNAT family N-acetyltransferase n=1 Tax=Brevibacillus fluminis TaxID=511487 RepID=UPI003F8BC362
MQTNPIEIISLTEATIDQEHICCSLGDSKTANGVQAKKDWLKARFAEGLRFKKGNVRGKVFIEYVPAEFAWVPVEAPGYLFINCLWVSGQFKGQGLAARLLAECVRDAQEMNGIVVIAGKGKRPYLSDKKFFIHHGFVTCDAAPPYFELLVKRFRADAPLPRFCGHVQQAEIDERDGLQLFYTNQCPFTEFYADELEQAAREAGMPFGKHKLATREEARRAPSPYTSYSLFYRGKFVTHEIMTKDKFHKMNWEERT